jgi:hypothetical protein
VGELGDDPQRHHPGGVDRPSGGGFSGTARLSSPAPLTSPANAAGIQVLYATMVGAGVAFGAPDSIGLFQSTNQGGGLTMSDIRRRGSGRHKLRRLRPYGRRSRLAW